MCELYCLADAIFVGTDRTGPETIDPEAVKVSRLPGQMRRDHILEASKGDLAPLAEYRRLGPLLQEGARILVHDASNGVPRPFHISDWVS